MKVFKVIFSAGFVLEGYPSARHNLRKVTVNYSFFLSHFGIVYNDICLRR